MALPQLLREIEDRGVTLMIAPVEPRLRFRPASRLTPEMVEGLRTHKAQILERLEGGQEPPQNFAPVSEPTIRDAGEVLQLARSHFGEISPEYREEVPYPPPEKGTDPMVHKHTDKARFFQGVRGRDLRRREREGLPPWIRIVDGGGAALRENRPA